MANHPKSSKPKMPLSEKEYLQREARESLHAANGSAKAMFRDAGRLVDPRPWTREHPFTALGAAFVTGLTAGMAATPGKKVEAPRNSNGEAGAENPRIDVKNTPKHPFLSAFFKEMVSIVLPLAKSIIAAQIARAASADDDGHKSNK
jgi:hypothetical protein